MQVHGKRSCITNEKAVIQAIVRFVLEKWITPHPFRNANGDSDLQVASGADARKVLEEHWGSWIQDSDWQWIIQHGYNTVRIPVCLSHGSRMPTNFAH